MDAMTKGQRNLLLFLLGVVILVVPIRFGALSNFEDRKELVSKKDEQQVYYNSLKAKDVNRDQYIKDTENYKKEYEKAQDKIKEQELKIAILEDLLKKNNHR